MKKVKLNKKPKKVKDVYFSGFCATDNKNFALFNVPRDFLVDKGYANVLNFKLTEDELWMLIDRNKLIKPSKGLYKVTFKDYGLVERKHFELINSINKFCSFHPVIEWFGKRCNRLIVALPEKTGKPIGILKTVKIDKE